MTRVLAGGLTLAALLVAQGCGDDTDSQLPDAAGDVDLGPADPYPEPGDWEPNRGPGGPTVTFAEEDLYQVCAFLDGGPLDIHDHHNLVAMYDGYLLMPWAPEWGAGGLSFFDISEPCAPVHVGTGTSPQMRETHSIGFSHHDGGSWAVVDGIAEPVQGDVESAPTGVQFWDLSDVTAPEPVSLLTFEGADYPDAYKTATLSVFWQGPYVYAGGADHGVHIIDASDPRNPAHVLTYGFEPVFRVGQVQVVGNLLVATGAKVGRTVLLDISDPGAPQPIPNGDFVAVDRYDAVRDPYFTTLANGFIFYARNDSGGGLLIYDIRDPSVPTLAGDLLDWGDGGYVFVKDELAFVGASNFATIYDISDMADIKSVAMFALEGDLDTITPVGNVALLAVDDKANLDEATAVAPWTTEVDTRAPRVTWTWPADGAEALPTTSRIGVTFSELVDPKSAWEGSVRVYESGASPAHTRVVGWISAQESIVNFWPVEPLAAATSYTLEISAGGVADYNGNAVAETFTMTFKTVGD